MSCVFKALRFSKIFEAESKILTEGNGQRPLPRAKDAILTEKILKIIDLKTQLTFN